MIREVGLDPKTNDYIKNWMAFRPHPEMGPMFITKDGTPPKANHVRRWLPRLAKIAGIRRRVHPHGLRHTFARQLYDEGVGMVDIMHALGHTRLDTTQRYLQSVGCGRSVSINQGREW